MYKCGPGLCVIMNNIKFDDQGSGKKDEASLKFIFTSLGFDVRVHQNLTAAQVECIVKGYSQMEHKGAFFLIISSRGGEGDVVYGTDGGEVRVHDLVKHFTCKNCPSLAGIPKVFMIDACRGDKDESVYSLTSKSGSQSSGMSNTMSVTDSADVMTIFVSTRGNIAGSNKNEGSCFVQMFAQVVKKVSTDYNLVDIVLKVHKKFQNLTIEYTSTFSKSYYIKRFDL